MTEEQKCFSCLIKYKIVGKGWVKCTINSIKHVKSCVFSCLNKYKIVFKVH